MDLVSSLPDGVLCHILSFLTTKEAALTSVLSKRWLNLWTFVPNLDFDDSEFLHPEEGKRERDGILQSFMSFVNRVLRLKRDSPIKKFSLTCKTGVDRVHVNRWIDIVLLRGVSNLDLSIDHGGEYFLPLHMFFSKKLVEMRLRSDCGVSWCAGGDDNFLPVLKTLVIDSRWIYCGKIEMFLPYFPVLEELEMVNIEWTDLNETVSSTSLRKLTICGIGGEEFSNLKSICFDIPSLIYLDYSDYAAEDYPKVNLPNLVEALLNISLTEDQIKRARVPNNDGDDNDNDEDDVFLRFGNVWKLMSGIKNVQELYLSSDTLEVLSLCCASIPVFNNLKELHIMSDMDRGWQAMPVILRNCRHLETLVLEGLLHYVTDKCGDACDCIPLENKGRSLISCPVKYIQIKRFGGTMRELEMIEHFLESFKCLEEMEIFADEENGSKDLEVPVVFELIVKTFKLYNTLYTCDVKFLV